MGRKMTGILVLLLCASFSGATAGEVSIGVKGGLDMFNITETPDEWDAEKSFRLAFAGGVFVNYAFSGNFSLQPELLLVMKGAKGTVDEYDVTAKFDYIEMPVLLKYSFPTEGRFKPCLFAGPSFAVNIISDFVVKAEGTSMTADFSDAANKVDLGIVAGGGLDLGLKKGTFTLDLRYSMSFNKLIKGGEITFMGITQEIPEEEAKSYGFTMMAGYAF